MFTKILLVLLTIAVSHSSFAESNVLEQSMGPVVLVKRSFKLTWDACEQIYGKDPRLSGCVVKFFDEKPGEMIAIPNEYIILYSEVTDNIVYCQVSTNKLRIFAFTRRDDELEEKALIKKVLESLPGNQISTYIYTTK